MTNQEIIILKEKIEKLNSHRFIISAKTNIIKELQKNYKNISCELKVKYSWQTDTPINVNLLVWATVDKGNGIRGGFEKSSCGKTVKSALNEILRSFNYFYSSNASIH